MPDAPVARRASSLFRPAVFGLGLLSALLALFGAGQAQAATTIGSDLSVPPQGNLHCNGGCTFVQRAIPGRQVTSPIDGVVVRWRVKIGSGGTAQPVKLRLVRGSGAASTAVGSDPEALPAAAAIYTFDARLPIKSGDFIGLDGWDSSMSARAAPGAATSDSWAVPQLGETETGRAPDSGAYEILINADIEPDADGDGFGDETQDNCAGLSTADQTDTDGDAQGDVCDPDDDNDGLLDASDNCPTGAGAGADTDGDGCKDAGEDSDDDNDTVGDGADACPLQAGSVSNGGCRDSDPPETSIVGGPEGRTTKTKAKFTFTSNKPGSTFQCKLTGKKVEKAALKQYGPCTSRQKYKLLEPGKYKFLAYATDTGGNADPTPAMRKFRVVESI
jgi:ferredoxin